MTLRAIIETICPERSNIILTERGMDYGAELSADLLYSIDNGQFNRVRVSLGEAPVMVGSVKVS